MREIDVPVLALSQLNRAPETRTGKKPVLADLKDSGAIEQEGIITSFSIVQMGPIPYVSAVVDCGGTSVKCTIMNVEPSPEHVTLGMQVKLMTYSMGEDSEGTEAIAFGFEPI